MSLTLKLSRLFRNTGNRSKPLATEWGGGDISQWIDSKTSPHRSYFMELVEVATRILLYSPLISRAWRPTDVRLAGALSRRWYSGMGCRMYQCEKLRITRDNLYWLNSGRVLDRNMSGLEHIYDTSLFYIRRWYIFLLLICFPVWFE